MNHVIVCRTHQHSTTKGFIACKHAVYNPPLAVHAVAPTDEPGPAGLGEILCADCHEQLPPLDELMVICGECARTLFGAVLADIVRPN